MVSGTNRRDQAHRLAATLLNELGRNLLVLDLVLVEADQLLRSRVGAQAARDLLKAVVARGEHRLAVASPGLVRRAIEFDEQFAGLNLGLVDGAVMALAEREGLAILTFDFQHFRATKPSQGYWDLLVDETLYAAWVNR